MEKAFLSGEKENKQGPYRRKSAVEDEQETELQELSQEEDMKNLSEKVREKEGHSGSLASLDKGVKERIGRRNEVKILETKAKQKARK